ncbi:MAG: T9SS type A sorting domain-containing protein [Bacteroidota bacterium]
MQKFILSGSTFLILQIGLLTTFHSTGIAQIGVDINLNVKHLTGSVSEFDRSKFIFIHAGITDNEWDSDEQRKSFLEDYDVYMGRNNGSIVWEYNNTKEDANNKGFPDVPWMQQRGRSDINNYKNKVEAHQFEDRYDNMMIGGQEFMYPNGQTTRPPGNSSIAPWAYKDYNALAEFYANYLTYYFGEGGDSGRPRPRMVEVMNEPFVKANKLGTTRASLSEMHNVVAKRIRQDHPDIMVGGYTAAHPAFESGNFNHWRNNWKLFIDVAGEEMDFFSFHLYDFVGDRNRMQDEMQRKGSNIEAIMDMINHYSYLKLGATKPWSISEYGWFCPPCDSPYYVERDWYNLRSFNSMMVQLMERQDQILNAVPFMILKARWAHNTARDEYNTYGPRLMREIGELEGEPAHGGWVYTEFIKFFEFWKDLKGTRIDTKASDLDLLADAYVVDNKVYLVLSNLEHSKQTVKLNFMDTPSTVERIMVKHLYETNFIPQLDTTYFDADIEEIELGKEATMILEYTFSEPIDIPESSQETSYFAEQYFQAIQANTNHSFNIKNVETGEYGEATLRLGLGRAHNRSLRPELKVNGTVVNVPNDWRGYDQKTRDQFFGVLEIPVPYSLLQENNTISIKFGDSGGHISSLALQVFNFSVPIERSDFSTNIEEVELNLETLELFPNPSKSRIYIKNLPQEKRIDYSIFDLTGKELRVGQLSGQFNTIDIENLAQGTYLIEIRTENQTNTMKFVKH